MNLFKDKARTKPLDLASVEAWGERRYSGRIVPLASAEAYADCHSHSWLMARIAGEWVRVWPFRVFGPPRSDNPARSTKARDRKKAQACVDR